MSYDNVGEWLSAMIELVQKYHNEPDTLTPEEYEIADKLYKELVLQKEDLR